MIVSRKEAWVTISGQLARAREILMQAGIAEFRARVDPGIRRRDRRVALFWEGSGREIPSGITRHLDSEGAGTPFSVRALSGRQDGYDLVTLAGARDRLSEIEIAMCNLADFACADTWPCHQRRVEIFGPAACPYFPLVMIHGSERCRAWMPDRPIPLACK